MYSLIKYIATIIFLVLIHLYFSTSELVKKVDYNIYDLMMLLSNQVIHEDDNAFYTVIVDIDERSLEILGQWPWPRVINANLITEIATLNPSAIGVNILFPEVDRLSPINIQAFYKRFFDLEVGFEKLSKNLKDNDQLFLESLQATNVTLATYFYDNIETKEHCREILYRENILGYKKSDLKANAFLCNHEKLQKGVESFGFLNAWEDSDGIFRRVPLLINYQEHIFPSFALAILLSVDMGIAQDIQDDTILLHFPSQTPKVFSAIDILSGTIPQKEIQGKIVVLGSSVIGLSSIYTIATGQKISSSMIHAIAMDNILNKSYMQQPLIYKKINIGLSFILSLWIFFLFSRKRYLQIVMLLFLTALISMGWMFSLYLEQVYISIAYLWVPLLSLFLLLLIYHLKRIHQEQQEQEKMFIRQSKLASMGEMISLIAHQWRQPLSSINGIVLNMDIDYRQKRLDMKRFDAYLNDIETTTAYLSRTINDFTDFFSKNKNRDRFYLEEVITQAKYLSILSTQKNVQVIYRTQKSIEMIGYKSELIQSLLIILNNAIYACQKNSVNLNFGKIYIDAMVVDKKLRLSIEDNGGGIKVKDLKKIFDPYFTTKTAQHGTGLGLYILKLIVEDSMNGKVFVCNGKEGAIFTLEIPINTYME